MADTLTNVKWSLRYFGLLVTCVSLFGRIAAKFGWKFSKTPKFVAYKDRVLDQRFGISTVGTVLTKDMGVDVRDEEHAIEYSPTGHLEFGILLEKLGRCANFSQYSFIDFGSGKGRVVLMASEFPFIRSMGVEMSPLLHAAAEQNIRTFRSPRQKCQDVRSINGDATTLEIPDGPIVAFFFNPFDDVILSQVMANMQAAWDASPRDMICIYHNPVHRDLFDDSDFWAEQDDLCDDDDQWVVYASQPVPTAVPAELLGNAKLSTIDESVLQAT